MDILTIAIQKEGTAAALAKKLGVAPNVIGNWKTRGVPDGWLFALRLVYAKAIKQQLRAQSPVSVS
jgi:uncharacterized protein YjcR